MSQPTSAVAKTTGTGAVTHSRIKDELQSPAFRNAVAQVLPKCLTPERFLRVAILATTRTPKLLQCDRASFFNALMSLSQYGLEPDGRRAHLIPFENRARSRNGPPVYEVQLIIDYKGLAELIYRSGVVSYLHADVVREGDVFEFSKGELTAHVPWFLRRDAGKPDKAGRTYAVYAVARMKDGSEKADVLSIDEVNAIRDNSQGWRAFKKGYAKQSPWDPANPVSEQEMQKKTAFRRLAKWLPLSPEIRDAVEHDDEPAAPTLEMQSAPSNGNDLVAFVGAQPEAHEPEPEAGDVEAQDDGDLGPQKAPEPTREPASTAQAQAITPQQELAEVVSAAGYDFNTFARWGEESGSVPNAPSLPDYDAVPRDVCERLLKAFRGAKSRVIIIQQLMTVKGQLV